MVAALDVRLALRDLVGRDPRRREQLHQVGTGEALERPCVGDLMDAAADEQEPGQRAGGGMLDRLVDLELAVAGAGLEEEVVGQVLDEVAGGEDVVAVPGTPLRVLRQRALATGQEVVRIADALQRRKGGLRRAGAVRSASPR